jgi:hypothetical protein
VEGAVPFLRHPATGNTWLVVCTPPPIVGDRVKAVNQPFGLAGHVLEIATKGKRLLTITVEHDDGEVRTYEPGRLFREDA